MMPPAKRSVPLCSEGQRKAEEQRARVAKEQEPILIDLRAAGYDIAALSDLWLWMGDRQAAIQILLRNFPLSTIRNRATIARVLVLPEAKSAWAQMVRFYRSEPEKDGEKNLVKEGLAAWMCELADNDVIEDVVELAEDPSQGTTRALLFPFLAKTSSPLGGECLKRLEQDSQLGHTAKLTARAARMRKL